MVAKKNKLIISADRIKRIEQQVLDCQDEIRTIEYSLIDLYKQQTNASPRAIEQGWVHEAKMNVLAFRNSLTTKKLYCIFTLNLQLQTVIDKKQFQVDEIQKYLKKATDFDRMRTEELMDYWAVRLRKIQNYKYIVANHISPIAPGDGKMES